MLFSCCEDFCHFGKNLLIENRIPVVATAYRNSVFDVGGNSQNPILCQQDQTSKIAA
jgi:hypothetical protein